MRKAFRFVAVAAAAGLMLMTLGTAKAVPVISITEPNGSIGLASLPAPPAELGVGVFDAVSGTAIDQADDIADDPDTTEDESFTDPGPFGISGVSVTFASGATSESVAATLGIDENGHTAWTADIPDDLLPGSYTVTATATAADGQTNSTSISMIIA